MQISPRARARLNLNADDYGIRDTVSRILPLAQAGKLDRVSVMTRYCQPSAAKALAATGVKLDIHLDLIELMGRGEEVGQGTLRRGIHFVVQRLRGELPAIKVEAAWRLQILRFHELFGRYPDGLNSHEHVHFFPSFYSTVVTLAHEFQIPSMRFGARGLLLASHHSLIGRTLDVLARINRRRFIESGLVTSIYLVSLDWVLDEKKFFRALELLPEGERVELVVHPERDREFDFIQRYL